MTDYERHLGSRWFEEVWNKGRREAIAEMLAPNAVLHEGATDTAGAEGFYRSTTGYARRSLIFT